MPSHEDQPETTTSTEKSPTYWFDDGNVILQVGDNSFRVHTSVLSRHSVVFRDLFKLPQTSPDMRDGCVVVQLHDIAGDVEVLLAALYDGCSMYFGARSCIPFSTIACLIRLGHKYQMEHIFAGAITRLKSCFVASFVECYALRSRGSRSMSFVDADAIEAVNLARLTQIGTVLPTALYICGLLPNNLLLHGVPRKNGTVERLSSEDIIRCLDGRANLLAALREKRFKWFFAPTIRISDGCRQEKTCKAALKVMAMNIVKEGLITDLSFLDNVGLDERKEQHLMCQSCWQMVQHDDERECEAIWCDLPQHMGVTVVHWNIPWAAQGMPHLKPVLSARQVSFDLHFRRHDIVIRAPRPRR
ncbi:uncharacterized protein B0H18DRAFT_872508 [Fomitopsis serialis]|uniref:uncharacterized protein n=1 Tax=Fomitopsis serialis TaxID=139415 RepID=UPI0020072CA2|nr:uncharacterized protein B0H18DRAFT_872508 [Neoantrodia serialis]KAH9930859.1 hypothetical protein B0H18DRAFT_872508 [Neoantrodia serialis]